MTVKRDWLELNSNACSKRLCKGYDIFIDIGNLELGKKYNLYMSPVIT